MRADALSSLVEEERKIADERRREFAERERAAGVELAEALSIAAHRVDERLRAWGDDLDRAQQSLETDLRRLEQRQKQLIADAETRIEAEASELVTTSDEQRASVIRLREELERSAQSAVSEALEELEAHTAERRRVIEEIADRLRRREQALMEQVERAENRGRKQNRDVVCRHRATPDRAAAARHRTRGGTLCGGRGRAVRIDHARRT